MLKRVFGKLDRNIGKWYIETPKRPIFKPVAKKPLRSGEYFKTVKAMTDLYPVGVSFFYFHTTFVE